MFPLASHFGIHVNFSAAQSLKKKNDHGGPLQTDWFGSSGSWQLTQPHKIYSCWVTFSHRNVPFIVGKKSPYVALKKLVSYSSDARHGPIILLYYIPITGCSNHYCWLYQPLWLRVPLFIIHDTPIISGYIPLLLVIHYQKPLVWGCPYLSSMISLLLMVISHYCWLLGVAVTFALTLHTSHFTLRTSQSTLHTSTLPTASFTLQTSHFTLHTARFALQT